MKKVNRILFALVLVILFSACKKNHDKPAQTPTPTGPELPEGVHTKEVQIILPENSPVDLAGCEIYSLALTSGVDAGGKSKAVYSMGNPNIMYVFDKNKNLILAGFITDSTNTISVASTAEVLIYSGLGVSFEPYEVRQVFISSIGKVDGVPKWKTKLEEIFKSDPLMLKKGLFVEPLKEALASLKKNGTILRKPADITVDANDTRSGLQLAESGLNHFTLTNNFRRRAHTFIYKMGYTDLDGKKHYVNSEINGDVAAISDKKITPTTAIRDWAGTMQSWMASYMAGKQLEFASTTSDPIEIPLEDNELQAKFKVRVVGPGMPSYMSMTSTENERWKNLALQTVLFDYMMPILLDAMGHNEILQKMNSSFALGNNLENLQKLVNGCRLLIEAIPAASDALESGDYGKVVTEVFFSIANGSAGLAGGALLKLVYESIADYVYTNGSEYYKDALVFDDRLDDLTSVLQILDMGLKLVDYLRITSAIADSKTLEEWDLVAKEVQLNLDPKEFTLGMDEQKKLTTYIKSDLGSDAPVIEYAWETTGKYGYLWDDRGHKGTSFSSSIKEAYYLCTVKESDLDDGKHADTIKVTAYLKSGQTRTKIGTAVSLARITKENKNVFIVPLTPDINIKKIVAQNGKVSYNFGPPFFHAEFEPRTGARYYMIRHIRPDGTMSAQSTPTLKLIEGKEVYNVLIGSMIFGDGVSEAQMLVAKERNQKLIDAYPFNAIEVTVYY